MGAVDWVNDKRAGIPSPVKGRLHFQGICWCINQIGWADRVCTVRAGQRRQTAWRFSRRVNQKKVMRVLTGFIVRWSIAGQT